MPSQAGELWAQAGKTALAAGQQVYDAIRNSTLNPVVRKQMEYQKGLYNVGIDQVNQALLNKRRTGVTTTLGMQGPQVSAPATIPVAQQMNVDIEGAPPGANLKPTGPDTAVDQKGAQYRYNYSTGKWESATGSASKKAATAPTKPTAPAPTPPPAPGPNANPPVNANPPSHQQQMGQVSYPGSLYASNGSTQPTVPAYDSYGNPIYPQGQGFAAQGGGLVPSSIFASTVPMPAPAPFFAQGGGEVPTAPQQATQPTPGTVPGSLSDQYAQQRGAKQQQDLASWQGQTQTEPITADEAMGWIGRKTTLAKDATYLPHGGPNGEPAYAFHMRNPSGKGTGVNVVPVSQMIKDGAAPAAAAQNTSVVLSQSDQLKQQQQNTLAAPPAPTDQGGQQPPQQPTPGTAAPPAPGSYDPTAYQQAVAAQTANPQNLMAQAAPQAGVRSTDTGTGVAAPITDGDTQRTQAEAATPRPPGPGPSASADQTKTLDADADSQQPSRHWTSEVTPNGSVTKYTEQAAGGKAGAGFYTDRYYKGTGSWQTGLWTPLNEKRQQVLDLFGSSDNSIARQRGQDILDKEQVEKMSLPELDSKIAEASWWRNHPNPMDQNSENRFIAERNASIYSHRVLDQALWAQAHNRNPSSYGETAITHAWEAAARDGIIPPEVINQTIGLGSTSGPEDANKPWWQKAGFQDIKGMLGMAADPMKTLNYFYHAIPAGGSALNPFAYAMGDHMKKALSALNQLPESQGQALSSPDWPQEVRGLPITWPVNLDVGFPTATNPSKMGDVNKMVMGSTQQDQDDAINSWKAMVQKNDAQYVKDIKNKAYAGVRVPDNYIDDMNALSKPDGRIKDVKADGKSANPFRDDNGNLVNPYGPPPGGGAPRAELVATPTPTPTPTAGVPDVKDEDLETFIKNNPGKPFTWHGQSYHAPKK